MPRAKLQAVLTWLYSCEVNVRVMSFWDGGWSVAIGDLTNGFIREADFPSTNDPEVDLGTAAAWLIDAAREAYPRLRFDDTATLYEGT